MTYEDPYLVLGLTPAATDDEVRQAYLRLVRAHPPEREPAAFKRIRAAYERLKEPEQRIEADWRRYERWPWPTTSLRPPAFDLQLRREHVLALLAAESDLNRRAPASDYREVRA